MLYSARPDRLAARTPAATLWQVPSAGVPAVRLYHQAVPSWLTTFSVAVLPVRLVTPRVCLIVAASFILPGLGSEVAQLAPVRWRLAMAHRLVDGTRVSLVTVVTSHR